MSKKMQLDEKALVVKADSAVAEEELKSAVAVPGKPLPEDYDNIEIGKLGHLCLDPQGNYQPTWSSLMIHRTHDGIPERQYFCNGTQSWRVKTGDWVDVPPEIISLLECTVQEEVEMDITKANPLMEDNVIRVTRKIPRFSTNILPSA